MLIKKWCNISDNIVTYKENFDKYLNNKIITCNEEMIKQLNLIEKISVSDANVIIFGETGTGKELYAEYIHDMSNRNRNRHIKVNCATLSDTLFESEMFGYKPGSFTGALSCGKTGIFEIANEGTLFLDEISEMPKLIQSKFLRVLQENKITKIGDNEEISINVRIIVASNTHLKVLVQNNEFREDLFYRLNVINIKLLPLKDRKEDIILLTLYFLQKYNYKYMSKKCLTVNTMRQFLDYHWPGNVRELKHTIERLVLLSDSDIIDNFNRQHFDGLTRNIASEAITESTNKPFTSIEDLKFVGKTYKEIVSDFEIELITCYIKRYGSLRKAANELQISPSALSRKLKLYKQTLL